MSENRVLIYPKSTKLKEVKQRIKKVINKSQNISTSELIMRLNPTIRGWANYFSLGQSIHILNSIDDFLYKSLRVWLIKKISKSSRRALYIEYFRVNLDLKICQKKYSKEG